MRKLICILCAALVIMASSAAYAMNFQVFDLTWAFDRAIIFLPDGEKIEGAVDSWRDYEGSDMIQVEIAGVTYLTHSSNVILIND